MIYERDLDEAIAECQGKRNPDSATCMKLAAFLTIKQYMFGQNDERTIDSIPNEALSSYSYSTGDEDSILYESDTEFGQVVHGKKTSEIFPILDEVIETMRVLNPRLYDAAMRKLK